MNEQYPQSQNPTSQTTQNGKDCPPPKPSSSCPEPSPCPPAKPCPPPPVRPCPPPPPDPCAPTPPPPPDDDCCEKSDDTPPTPITTAAQQLEALRKAAAAEQKKLQKYEGLKAKLADDTTRIAALEKIIEGQQATSDKYTEFFRAIEVFRSALECSIPTIRCQLSINDRTKKCVRDAIAAVDDRIKKAKDASDAQNAEVTRLDTRQKKLQADLDWAKKWSDYFKSGLQTQVTAQQTDLKKLQALLDPSKDQCEVWFYLCEMESMLRSGRTESDAAACYLENINLATFIDCWAPKCYGIASEYWVVTFNAAESAQKVGAIELAEAQKLAADLDKAAKEAEANRRASILKELKTQDCCGPLSKCP